MTYADNTFSPFATALAAHEYSSPHSQPYHECKNKMDNPILEIVHPSISSNNINNKRYPSIPKRFCALGGEFRLH